MTVRLPKSLTERIDAHSKGRGESRSEFMRRWIEFGLASEADTTKPGRTAKKDKS